MAGKQAVALGVVKGPLVDCREELQSLGTRKYVIECSYSGQLPRSVC